MTEVWHSLFPEPSLLSRPLPAPQSRLHAPLSAPTTLYGNYLLSLQTFLLDWEILVGKDYESHGTRGLEQLMLKQEAALHSSC